jgi:hypothetical protein
VEVDYNTFFNCSSTQDLVIINTNDHVIANGNIFDSCVEHVGSFFLIKNSPEVEIHTLTITNTSIYGNYIYGSLVDISTQNFGYLLIENLNIYNNYIAKSAVRIDSSVGNVTIQHCDFHNETLSSITDYLVLENPYHVLIQNVTYDNINDVHDLTSNAVLMKIESVNLDIDGTVTIQDLYSRNSAVSLLAFTQFSGTTTGYKEVLISNVTIQNATFDTRNDLIMFGPYYVEDDVRVTFTGCLFDNLFFTQFANIVHLKQQSPTAFVFEDCTFTNNNGGSIMIEPQTINEDSLFSQVNFSDINVHSNEFKFSTFIIQKQHSDIFIYNCVFYENSAMFRGTALSIIEHGAKAHIFNSSFNRNNGLYGGVFSIDGNSHIDASNCSFASNFALTSSIAFVQNQGNIDFDY